MIVWVERAARFLPTYISARNLLVRKLLGRKLLGNTYLASPTVLRSFPVLDSSARSLGLA